MPTEKDILSLIQRACSKHSDQTFFDAIGQAQAHLELNEVIYNNLWGFAHAMFFRRTKPPSAKQEKNWIHFFQTCPVTMPNRQQDAIMAFLKMCPGQHAQDLLEKVVDLNVQNLPSMSPNNSYNFYTFIHGLVINPDDPNGSKRSLVERQGGEFFSLATQMIRAATAHSERAIIMLDILQHSPYHFVEYQEQWGQEFRTLPVVQEWIVQAISMQENLRMHQALAEEPHQPKERSTRKI